MRAIRHSADQARTWKTAEQSACHKAYRARRRPDHGTHSALGAHSGDMPLELLRPRHICAAGIGRPGPFRRRTLGSTHSPLDVPSSIVSCRRVRYRCAQRAAGVYGPQQPIEWLKGNAHQLNSLMDDSIGGCLGATGFGAQ